MKKKFKEQKNLIENLLVCTYSENYKVRAAAYTALGNFVNIEEVVYKLYEGINDEHEEVRDAAKKSLEHVYEELKEKEFFRRWVKQVETIKEIS